MKILVTGDLSSQKEFLESFLINVTENDNNAYIIDLPNNCRLVRNFIEKEDLLKSEHLSKYGTELLNYVATDDNSIKDLIMHRNTVIASSNLEKVDEKLGLPYDYMTTGDFRVYDKKRKGLIGFVGNTEQFIEFYHKDCNEMLENSTLISSSKKATK